MAGVTMTTGSRLPPPLLEWGVASLALPGQTVCGDLHLVQPFPDGALVAVVDGVGHGAEAAAAAKTAVATLSAHAQEPLFLLLQRCHQTLRETRGVALTLVSVNALDGTITWVGVGSVEGVLLRASREGEAPAEAERAARQEPCPPRAGLKGRPAHAEVLLYGGVVGLLLPVLRTSVLPVAPGDTLVLATDGINSGFAEGLSLEASPQQLADAILARDVKGTDDALVLVARYLGGAA